MATQKSMFVAMPFKAEYDPMLDVVKDAARLLNLRVIQVGEESFTGSIINYIRSAIASSDLLLAIVSEENGNVYYEIGLAHCQNKPVVLLTSSPETLKFDLRDRRAIVYDPKRPRAVRDELVATLRSALDATTDPDIFLGGVFHGTSGDLLTASRLGSERIMHSLAAEAHLQAPYGRIEKHMLPSGELAIMVKDFMGRTARAIVDRNGLIRDLDVR